MCDSSASIEDQDLTVIASLPAPSTTNCLLPCRTAFVRPDGQAFVRSFAGCMTRPLNFQINRLWRDAERLGEIGILQPSLGHGASVRLLNGRCSLYDVMVNDRLAAPASAEWPMRPRGTAPHRGSVASQSEGAAHPCADRTSTPGRDAARGSAVTTVPSERHSEPSRWLAHDLCSGPASFWRTALTAKHSR
jgi:hypothetical protein